MRLEKLIRSKWIVVCVWLNVIVGSFHPRILECGTYLNSAHGNSGYGVNRIAIFNTGYSRGNCAHCHEQHACINGQEPSPAGGEASPFALFSDNFTSQSDDFCFECHKGSGSVQTSFSRTNYNYSYWFGGDTVHHSSPDNIYDAFNPSAGSSHNLQDILNFVKQKWPETYSEESNPCNACHNPHVSQRGYPVVRPTDRNNAWGDSAGERMSDYAAAHGGQYMAPFRYNSTTTYEPDGSATTDGSNLPDYVTFCMDCHNASNLIYSTTLGRNLQKIDWARQSPTYLGGIPFCDNPGDVHGSIRRCSDSDGKYQGEWKSCGCIKDNSYGFASGFCRGAPVDGNGCCLSSGKTVPAPAWWGDLRPPYITANYQNFVLNCTDCHEPHGAVHGNGTAIPHLLRKTANGHYNKQCAGGPGNPCSWEEEFCRSCHHHRESAAAEVYIPEFDRTVTLNGGHCGNFGSCLNCHAHNLCAKCYACWYCGAPFGKSTNSF
ncbi:MAG TPA: hypothetical protein VK435_06520 [Thermodesulfovibrionales bacterium]|nr:hypothetical protein [Thermodesulfovibrionales bacterium]